MSGFQKNIRSFVQYLLKQMNLTLKLALKSSKTVAGLAFYFLNAFLACSLTFTSCYSFKGISIDPNVNTFFIQNFEVSAASAPPTLAVNFTERLKDKIRNETRLNLKSTDPDIEFTGKVRDFRVVPVAPQPGQVVALNRLEIALDVMYIDHKTEAKSWTSSRPFQHFAEFPNDKDLLSIQDQLIAQIFDQILEDIFNATFNDW
jgi:hypothetical protein